ncbi:type I phosphomannose isomerase catalytic subunit [Clostridium tetani]|uniref:Phosphomannose isomerase type I catalytic domain-containing protein n=1 Tax=Clostridium tetani TaxID=1513 RepID=A0ABY0ESV2_CLOTA|nr:type I phosphomannose isomerase catalytic subunit [Clostridium tetani]CDI48399.1 mannose-6-phosphate isomerase [Clostridium tetani 12124569]KHO40154.1 hypothetical protein OR62_01610 [Clostridium tetani]RXI41009.1 hypothetical protein DP129_02410 [Clostridium tetani]RXI58574.1 hypothetical protein DP131_01430 [Clostridium tetani]RXI73286.1 hypothetical protein DQN76_02915 [Clostridium tetani]
MYILKPVTISKIWGGNKLLQYGGDDSVSKIGLVYSVSCEKNNSNEILNGTFKGQTLLDVWNSNKDKFGYSKFDKFPLIISFIDANDDLSLQVHPDDDYAIKNKISPFGKEESWIFLDNLDYQKIVLGCAINSIDTIKKNINENKWQEILNYIPVQNMSYVNIKPGTLHALTSGSLVYEIQQATNVTYRFYDYNRVTKEGKKRELHLSKALEVLKPEYKSKAVSFKENEIIEEKYYSLWLDTLNNNIIDNKSNVFTCYTIIDGELSIDNIPVKKGMSFILMPKDKCTILGNAKVIISHPN